MDLFDNSALSETIDLEGMVFDSKVRPIRDRKTGMYFSPERDLVEQASNLYSTDESNMDTLYMDWTSQDTSDFIAI
ncbi:argininosuccinate synthase [Fusarium sp. NRRL 25303]|nr:argininosuccinate synthase [Fusarium sp. NRRL 25303]